MGASWLTTIFGAGAIVAEVIAFVTHYTKANTTPLEPDQWMAYIAGIIVGVGLIFSKSFNVSNSKDPAKATVVTPDAAAKPNPAAAIIKSIVLMILVVAFGIALTACASVKEFFGEGKNQLESIIAVTAAGTYHVSGTVKKDGNVLLTYTQVWECTQTDGKLTGCHKREPAAPPLTLPK